MSVPIPSRYCRGRILSAKVREARGGYKERPVIIVTPTAEIVGSGFQVVACTTQGENYPSPFNVPIPGGKHKGIPHDTDAVCDWMPEVKENDITGVYGLLKPKYLDKITALLESQK